MRMKIVWLPALIFCATLALVAASLDLGPTIKIAQCRSTCLRHHMIDGNCWNINKTDDQTNDCDKCWDICKKLGSLKKEQREENNICVQRSYQDCPGRETACTFYQTRGMEEDKYETTKLPAPEENEIIHMNNYDIAVLMQKNSQGIWKTKNYYYAKQQAQLTMIPDNWIIIVTDDGVVKQYSWEKWKPTLQLLKAGGPLYQAYIAWQDWRIQLKDQRKKITSNYFKTIFESWAMKEKPREYKPSFVVTWQQETGDGIMGNQVTDSESAQISLPCGKYLIRIATNDGPGSYPIVVDTGVCEIPKISIWNENESIKKPILIFLIFLMVYYCIFIAVRCLFKKNRKKNEKESGMEEGRLTKAEKRLKEENLTKMQKKPIRSVLRLCPDCSHFTINLLRIKGTDMNVNASVKTQDTSASTQNAKCENAKVSQKS